MCFGICREINFAPDMTKGRFRVAGLIVIPIDLLEKLESSVEKFCLVDLLNDYSAASPDRLMSLEWYIAKSKYDRMLRSSASLAETAVQVLETAIAMASERPGP